MITLRPHALTADAFAPYGDVIDTAHAQRTYPINYGNTTRFHDMAAVDTAAKGGRTGISLFRSKPLALPIPIRIMECHPVGSQAFIPLSARPYLVVVAPPGEDGGNQPDWQKLVAFKAEAHQGVNYAPGTWHHYSLALEDESDFLVIDRIHDSEAPEINLIEVEAPFAISLDLT